MTALTEKPQYLVGEIEWQDSVQVRPYEMEKGLIRLQFIYDPDDSEDVIVQMRDTILKAKTKLYEEFGKDFMLTDEGIAQQLVQNAFPGSQVIESHVPVSIEQQPPAVEAAPATPPHDPRNLAKPRSQMNDLEKAMAKANQAWAAERFRTHPHEFYDNTESKNAPNGNPNWPDFKHKETNIGFYVK